MSEDITKRLADISEMMMEGQPFNDGDFTDIDEAIDEINRLRREVATPRDEYAQSWLEFLDAHADLDILPWIRAYANAFEPSDQTHPKAQMVINRTDARLLEAADEIERLREQLRIANIDATNNEAEANKLRAERDETRREVCRRQRKAVTFDTAVKEAAKRGWDCFKEDGK